MNDMPSCLIRAVRSVELVASNVDEAARFYETVWNLQPVETPPPNPPPLAGEGREGACFFRGTGAYHRVLGLQAGAQPAVIRIIFDVADRQAIAQLHRTISAAGINATTPAQLATPGGGYGFGCKDPDGRNLFFVCDCADHADSENRADRPRKIAHVNLNARDFDLSLAFFTNVLGFRLVDENAPLWFLHCANRDHCSIVLAKTGLPTLNHIAFEMPDCDSVMRGIGRMKDSRLSGRMGSGPAWPRQQCICLFLRAGRSAAGICRRDIADRRHLSAAVVRALEIYTGPLRPMGHHAAALAALLSRAASVRLHRGRRSYRLTGVT
jgi:catechol 2,3-dioxygenase-like lactoylglutathione lyase family enzyme